MREIPFFILEDGHFVRLRQSSIFLINRDQNSMSLIVDQSFISFVIRLKSRRVLFLVIEITSSTGNFFTSAIT